MFCSIPSSFLCLGLKVVPQLSSNLPAKTLEVEGRSYLELNPMMNLMYLPATFAAAAKSAFAAVEGSSLRLISHEE